MSEKVTPIRGHLREAQTPKPRNGGGHVPDDCPVVPLGYEGGIFFYLDANNQFRDIEARAHNKHTITSLFAPRVDYLLKHWPKKMENGIAVDFRPDAVARALMEACAANGVWSPNGKLRGRGAWQGEDGDLVLHLGDRLLADGQPARPGRRGDFVYPVRPDRPGPARERQGGGEDGPGAELLRLLRCWNWSRGELDALLMLGWCCAGTLCGALDWRPHVWLGGPRGTGKSTLMRLVEWLFVADAGIITSADPTAAAIRSKLGQDALPVAFDEAEEDQRRLIDLIKLALIASSGGTIDRGTADHGAVQFQARFMGLFASISRLPLKASEASRIALLDLRKLEGGRAPLVKRDAMQQLGQRLLRRMADRWRIFLGRFERYHEALNAAGLDSRACDHWGTLLAAADTALHDAEPDSDTLDELVGRLVAATEQDRAEEKSDGERCLEHLVTSSANQWRHGEQRNLSLVLAIAARRAVLQDAETGETVRPGLGMADEAQRVLSLYGLRVVLALDERKRLVLDENQDPRGWLAVANGHAGLNQIFERTHWRGRSGTGGGWKGALLGLAGARLDDKRSYGGFASRGVLVPLELVLAPSPTDEG